jgi:hypothetical protein
VLYCMLHNARGRHTGAGGDYAFFAGRDATRAFSTGDFGSGGLEEDCRGLDDQELAGLVEWRKFYHETYIYVGR